MNNITTMLQPGMLIFAKTITEYDRGYFSFVVSVKQTSNVAVESQTISPNIYQQLGLSKTTYLNIKNFIPASCTLCRIT